MQKCLFVKPQEQMDSKYLDILRQYWGYDSFRGIQEEIITSIGEGKDTLGLMPTGGGKSICFQVPALALGGLCIVITPLISLMKDQVMQLKNRGIKAEAVYSGMSRDNIIRVLDNCILGDYRFLYISPERLSTELFLAKLERMRNICMITVDEAHCVSQWGYDFRPSYLEIGNIRQLIPYKVPILALTATATPKVVNDIQDKLRFRQKNCFSMSFERKNLIYVVRQTINKAEEMLHILKSMTQGSAIVYTRSRKLTFEIAQYLISNGITADNYHAGLTDAEKDLRQNNWNNGKNRVMVATNAFGMGIDKSNVRIVIHYNIPDSIEAYFQEAGRAGRDGNTAYAVALYNPKDNAILKKRIAETYPDIDYIRQTYENICYFFQIGIGEAEGRTFDFCIEDFCRIFRQFALLTDSSLRLLSYAGYIQYTEEQDFKSRLMFILRKEDLYHIDDYGKDSETVIQTILRTYSGVFADYVQIEEMHISHLTGIPAERIYNILKELASNRVITYIPRRNTPTITFTLPRLDTERISFPCSIYKDRKNDMEKRINYIIEYISSTNKCRSRMLLNYFGEKSADDCGTCDVCLQAKKDDIEDIIIEDTCKNILNLLNDGEWHDCREINSININNKYIEHTLKHMMAEEILVRKDNRIRINN